jgi:hypothetical protein
MSKPVSIPTAYAGLSGPLPLSTLDSNFNVLGNAINDCATYGNYFVDTGAVNAMVATTTPLSFSYAAGVPIQVLVANTNTNATVTLNVNGLGAINVINPDGSALSVGQIRAGMIVSLVCTGSAFQIASVTYGFAKYADTTANFTGALQKSGNAVVTSQSGTFTGTLTGCTTSPTATFSWSLVGTKATIYCAAGINATSNSGFMTITGVSAAIQPLGTGQYAIVRGIDNSASVYVEVSISGGTLTFGLPTVSGTHLFTGAFTSSGPKGIPAGWSYSYDIGVS